MHAIVIEDFDTSPVLRELPEPVAGPGEVLVRVEASSLNAFDIAVAAGGMRGRMEHRFPVVLGKDFAGVIAAIGPDAPRFSVGEEVFGVVMKPVLGDGAFGELVTVHEQSAVTHLPDGLDQEIAAALGVAGTAALAATDAAAIGDGDVVLIAGATGGVGTIAIQLAAATGAHVIATARPGEQIDIVRVLGAVETVDHGGDVTAAVRRVHPDGVDAVIHLAGDGPVLADLLVDGGRFVSALGVGPPELGDRPIAVSTISARPDQATLQRLAGEAVAGRLRIPIQARYVLEDVPLAIAEFAAGKLGKLVVEVD